MLLLGEFDGVLARKTEATSLATGLKGNTHVDDREAMVSARETMAAGEQKARRWRRWDNEVIPGFSLKIGESDPDRLLPSASDMVISEGSLGPAVNWLPRVVIIKSFCSSE